MSRPFPVATAEQVLAAVEAVAANRKATNRSLVEAFSDLPPASTDAALELAVDLGFLSKDAQGDFTVLSPLCQFTQLPNVAPKAAALRVALESYEPFVVFRARLVATGQVAAAAAQTQALLDLDAHRDEVSQTLVGLGTFAQALSSEGGGHHRPQEDPLGSHVAVIAKACADISAAEQQVRQQLGASIADGVSSLEVIMPLAHALLYGSSGTEDDAASAVTYAGNAVESYLVELAQRENVALGNASGIISKADKLAAANTLPSKLLQGYGRYLGQIRNGADHGIDPNIGASWTIRPLTAMEYVSVAIGFIGASEEFVKNQRHVL